MSDKGSIKLSKYIHTDIESFKYIKLNQTLTVENTVCVFDFTNVLNNSLI